MLTTGATGEGKKGTSPGTLGQRAGARHNKNHNYNTTNGAILQGVNGMCDSQNYAGWADIGGFRGG